jgi:hypothetical protein
MRKVFMISVALTGLIILAGACSTRHAIEVAPVEVKPYTLQLM